MKITGLTKTGTNRYRGIQWCASLSTDRGEPCGAITIDESTLLDLSEFSRAVRSSFHKTINSPATQGEWIDLLKRLVVENDNKVATS